MAKVTMRDVARMAGVSPTTVAHALNNNPDAQVAALTRDKVWDAANKLGYQRSLLQRSIKQSLRHVGIAVGRPGQEDESDTAALFDGIRMVALDRGYVPILQALPISIGQVDCSDAVARIVDHFRTKLLNGIILDKQCFANLSVTELHRHGMPVVTVNGSFEARTETGEPVPGITYDSKTGALLAMEHLLSLGHRRIALVTRPIFRYPVEYRPMLIRRLLEGYREALAKAGVPFAEELFLDARPDDRAGVEDVVEKLLALDAPPTAWFVADDVMAVMVINALKRRGKRVPDDFAVMGYGDQQVPVLLADPPLTTIRTDLRENGRQAAIMLLNLLEGCAPKEKQVLLRPELVVRQSTAPASNQLAIN